MDLVDFGEPSINHGRGLRDESMDLIRVERHVVAVVGVVGELVIENADRRHGEWVCTQSEGATVREKGKSDFCYYM